MKEAPEKKGLAHKITPEVVRRAAEKSNEDQRKIMSKAPEKKDIDLQPCYRQEFDEDGEYITTGEHSFNFDGSCSFCGQYHPDFDKRKEAPEKKELGWEKEFDKLFDDVCERGEGIRDISYWAPEEYKKLKEFIRSELQKARRETLEEVEKMMADTLSADTPKYHKEVCEMYKKLSDLKKKLSNEN